MTLIVTVVDDFVIVARDRQTMAEVKRRLRTVWKIVDKGPIQWVLNMRVHRDRPAGVLKIDQEAYIERKLREFGLDTLPAKRLPLKPSVTLSADMLSQSPAEAAEAKKLPYRSRTGALNYLRLTRPDMCCTNSILSQFNKQWGLGTPPLRHYNARLAVRWRHQDTRPNPAQKRLDLRPKSNRDRVV